MLRGRAYCLSAYSRVELADGNSYGHAAQPGVCHPPLWTAHRPPRDHLHGSEISVLEVMLPPVQTLTQKPNSGKQICKCELTWSTNLGSAIGHCLHMICVPTGVGSRRRKPSDQHCCRSFVSQDLSVTPPSVSRETLMFWPILQSRTGCRGTQRRMYLRQVQCPFSLSSGVRIL